MLANPKTVLNARYAKKEVKEKVIRADQLVNYIKDMYKNSRVSPVSEEKLLEWAQFYLDLHKNVEKDYTEKYEQYKMNPIIEPIEEEKIEVSIVEKDTIKEDIIKEDTIKEEERLVEETEIFKELKKFRLDKSREEKIKPFYIFNNKQLNDLIIKMPRNNEELQNVDGFGEMKANKYGEDIVSIIEKYS